MRVCSSCGLVACPAAEACEGCARAFDTPDATREAGGRAGDAVWAALRCSFECRACGRAASLDHLDADGLVTCALCGTDQAFEPRAWNGLLVMAHGVADLAGDADPGKVGGRRRTEVHNPHANVGVTRALVAWDEASSPSKNPLHARIGPGHPLCPTCGSPFQASFPDEGAVVVHCETCSLSTRYEAPERLRKGHPDLAGALAPAHRADLARANVTDEGAAIVLACPSCSAPIKPEASSSLLTCGYCKTVSLVPPRAWARLGLAKAEPSVIWCVFSGPSPERRKLVAEAEREAEEARRKDDEGRERSRQGVPDDRPRGNRPNAKLVASGKRWTGVWFVTWAAMGVAIFLVGRRFVQHGGKIPGLIEAAGFVMGAIALLFCVWAPNPFFGMPMGKKYGPKEPWQPTDRAAQRQGMVALSIVVAIGVVAIALMLALAPR